MGAVAEMEKKTNPRPCGLEHPKPFFPGKVPMALSLTFRSHRYVRRTKGSPLLPFAADGRTLAGDREPSVNYRV